MFRPILETPPGELPVTRRECKMNGVIDYDDDDILIERHIQAATAHLDGFRGVLGRCMVNQTWTLEQPDLSRSLTLPVPDVSSVEIRYRDTDDADQTVPSGQVFIHPVAQGTSIIINDDYDLPDLSDTGIAPVNIAFTAGFGASKDVPWALKLAIMQMTRQLYDDRGGTGSIEAGSTVRNLIAPYRWVRV